MSSNAPSASTYLFEFAQTRIFRFSSVIMSMGSYVSEARAAWRLLNGIFCVYKPAGMGSRALQNEIRKKLAIGLNAMKVREPEPLVEIKRIENAMLAESKSALTTQATVNESGDDVRSQKRRPPISNLEKSLTKTVLTEFLDGPDKIQIVKGPNLADHTLVVGPRYQPEDIRLYDASSLGVHTSGLTVLGINKGTRLAYKLVQLRWLRTYVLSGEFGTATMTGFKTGKIIDKATFHKLSRGLVEKSLSSTQAAHQKTMFEASGVRLNTDRAYEIASQGPPRPDQNSVPLIYNLKCIKFDPPHFDIEMTVLNEKEDFLVGFIHDFGIRLHTAAVTTKIRCIKYGPFTLDMALLPKHYDPENIINNTIKTKKIIRGVDLNVRDPIVTSESFDGQTLRPNSQNLSNSKIGPEYLC